ncbi:TPA: LamG domain-containing protein [Candidatus Woesearchaeota archaeon]|nr:LamG domain-containing protein [Candidatus Woesearchaeota archaeon]
MSKILYSRAQAGFEFIALVGFMFMIFVVFLGIINQRTVEFQEEKNQQSLKDLGDVIKKEIDLATKAEPGYSRLFNLPPTINSKNYNATIQKGGLVTNIVLTFYGFSSQFAYVVKVPHGVFAQGIGQGDNLIEKNESLIVLNKAEIDQQLALLQEDTISTKKEEITERGPQQQEKQEIIDPFADDVAYFKFNEQSGDTPDTTVRDYTPNNHQGFTQTGLPKVEFVQGLEGNALKLDGRDDSIKVENSQKLNFAGGDFTIMGWIKTDIANSVILSKDSYAAEEGWGVSLKNEKLSYNIYGDAGTNIDIDDIGAKIISIGNWHHIAVVHEADKYKFYVDGALNSERPNTAFGTANSFNLRIGYKNKDYVQGTDVVNNQFVEKYIAGAFSGQIDELKIYSKALSIADVQAEYDELKAQAQGLAPSIGTLVKIAAEVKISDIVKIVGGS